MSCGIGGVALSFCHVTSRGYTIKSSCDLVSYQCPRFDIYKSYGSGDIALFLSCDITRSHDQKDMWLDKWEPLNLKAHSKF